MKCDVIMGRVTFVGVAGKDEDEIRQMIKLEANLSNEGAANLILVESKDD